MLRLLVFCKEVSCALWLALELVTMLDWKLEIPPITEDIAIVPMPTGIPLAFRLACATLLAL
jgi:hypothetical protein